MNHSSIKIQQLPDSYLELIRQFPLRPIRSDDELDQAIGIIDSLLDRESLDLAEEDYLEVLSDLVERYETEVYPIPAVSDTELLRHLIDAKGVTQAEVARQTGIAESRISEVLAGKRTLNRSHISKLVHYFGIEPGVFAFETHDRSDQGR